MEQVRGEDGWSEETQEDETAHCCVTDVLVHCVGKKKKKVNVMSGSILAVEGRINENILKLSKASFVIQRQCA